MPEWLTAWLEDWTAVQLVMLVVGLIAVFIAVRKAWPVISELVKLVDSLRVLPEFVARTERTLTAHGETLAVIHHEVLPNNGGSLADSTKRLEESFSALAEDVSHVKKQQASTKTTLARATRSIREVERRQKEGASSLSETE